MKRRSLGISIALILAVFLAPSHSADVIAQTQFFYRNMALGSTGEDVRMLQKLLNTDPRTTVAVAGPGSAGQETTDYWFKTQDAVRNFQTIHSPAPPPGSAVIYHGNVDDNTRVDLNNYAASINFNNGQAVATPTPQQIQNEANAQYKMANISVIPGFPYIDAISPSKVKNGEMITIYGRNFSTTTSNIVHMTYNDAYATSTDGVTLRVQVKSYLNELFDNQTRSLSSRERADVIKKIPDIPLFILVENGINVSNPHIIYFNIK